MLYTYIHVYTCVHVHTHNVSQKMFNILLYVCMYVKHMYGLFVIQPSTIKDEEWKAQCHECILHWPLINGLDIISYVDLVLIR